MALEIKKSYLVKGATAFLLLSFAVIAAMLFWTTESETWSQVLDFQKIFIPFIVILAVLRWLADGMAFVTMAKQGSHRRIPVFRAANIRLQGALIAGLVPVLLGTFTMHAYLLHKEKMKVHEAITMTVLRAIIPVFIFLLNIPILCLIDQDLNGQPFFTQFLKIITIPLLIIVLFLIITLSYPHVIQKWAVACVRWWGRIKFFHAEKILVWEERVFHEVDKFHEILYSYFKTGKRMLLTTAFWILTAFIIDYLIAIGILWGFGYQPEIIGALAYQFLIRPIIYFAFTPGGAGIWEGSYLGFFSIYMPQNLLGVSVLMWRLLVSYIPMILGIVLLFREFHSDQKLKKILLESEKREPFSLIEAES